MKDCFKKPPKPKEVQRKYFMAPTLIREHNWVPLNTPDPINKQVVAVLSNSTLVLVQEIVHTVLSYFTAIVYVLYTYRIEEVITNYATTYQTYLTIVHVYFALEYLMRVMRMKTYWKFIWSSDSMIEIITTLPFLPCIFLNMSIESSFWYRFVMMNDLGRLCLARRLLNLWDDDMWPGILKILNDMIFFVLWSSGCI